jgi:hypothetical protein
MIALIVKAEPRNKKSATRTEFEKEIINRSGHDPTNGTGLRPDRTYMELPRDCLININ